MLLAMMMVVWAQRDGDAGGALAGLLSCCCPLFFILVFTLPQLAGMWKTFEKAGKPGWAAIVPIYNVMVMAEIGGKDATYGLLCLIPVAGIVFLALILIELCKAFGKEAGYAVGMLFLPFIFWPLLGFSDAKYIGVGPPPMPRGPGGY